MHCIGEKERLRKWSADEMISFSAMLSTETVCDGADETFCGRVFHSWEFSGDQKNSIADG